MYFNGVKKPFELSIARFAWFQVSLKESLKRKSTLLALDICLKSSPTSSSLVTDAISVATFLK